MSKTDITIDFMRECFEIDYANGGLIWRERPGHHFTSEINRRRFNARHVGNVPGSINRKDTAPRRSMMLLGVGVLVHRIVFALHHGLNLVDVPDIIDHRDGDALNNKPDNLRPATHSQNIWNSRGRPSKSGHKGVFRKKREKFWRAQICANGKYTPLGKFEDKEDAAAAYRAAALSIHGEFARF